MIDRLDELNRVLIAASTIATPGDSISQAAVVRQCESEVIESTLPDHKMTIDFAETMGLLSTTPDRMVITAIGKDFMALNPERTYELTNDQKRMLIRSQYLSGINRLGTLQLLKSFTKNFGASTFQWSKVDGPPLVGDQRLIAHLLQLGVLQQRKSILEVNTKYVDSVAILLAEGRGWSPKDIEELYAEKKKIGEIAEELMLKYEKERLKHAGGNVECLCINHVSKLRPDAGYDLESFDAKASAGMVHDRFIEVKGAKGTSVFYMSENEIKVAKNFKDKYWVYFLGGINTKTRTAKHTPLLIQNPVKSISDKSKYSITRQGIRVEII